MADNVTVIPIPPPPPPMPSPFMKMVPAIGHTITGLFVLLVSGMQSNPDMAASYGFPAGIVAILGQVIAYVASEKNQKDTETAKTHADSAPAIPPVGTDAISNGLAILLAKAGPLGNEQLVKDLSAAMLTHTLSFKKPVGGGQ